jgi:hypothetical protein
MPVFQLALPEELRTWDTSPLAWRWKYLAGLQGDFVQHARYFCALDEATDPNCVLKHPALQNGAGARRMQTMGPLKDFLHQRILLRSRSELDSALFRANSEQHCAPGGGVEGRLRRTPRPPRRHTLLLLVAVLRAGPSDGIRRRVRESPAVSHRPPDCSSREDASVWHHHCPPVAQEGC